MLVQSLLFDRKASSHPAVVCADRGVTASYADLARNAEELAARLARAGLRGGERAAILLPNSIEFAAAFFGSLTAGAVAVPMDIYLRKDDLLRILAVVKPAVLITNHNLFRKIKSDLGSVKACLIEYGAGLTIDFPDRNAEGTAGEDARPKSEFPDDSHPGRTDPAEDALMIMSSGTTGLPKAVRLSHRAVLNNIGMHLESLDLSGDIRGLQVLPLNFSYGLIASFLGILRTGGTAVLLPNPEPGPIWEAIGRYDINLFSGTPTLFQYIIEKSTHVFSAAPLRYLTIGGDRCKRYALDLIRSEMPSARVYITYGLSEAGPRVSTLPHELIAELPNSVGLPLKGVEVSILDAEGKSCSPCTPGEIVVRSPSLMNGYFGDADRTARVLQGGRCHTSDIGYVDGRGFLYYVGRKDRQFKFGGRNVNPSFIEQCISTHPLVREVHVAKIETDRDEMICARIKAGDCGEEEMLRELTILCRKHMPAYMVPAEFVFEDHDHYYYKGKIFNPRKEQLPSGPVCDRV